MQSCVIISTDIEVLLRRNNLQLDAFGLSSYIDHRFEPLQLMMMGMYKQDLNDSLSDWDR